MSAALFGEVDRIHLVVPNEMPDPMDLRRIRKDPVVLLHRLVFPATFPQPVNDIPMLIGNVVTRIMIRLGSQPHSARGTVQVPGDDVPLFRPKRPTVR